jgi:hypothetical protein
VAPLQDYNKYAGMAFELLAMTLIMVFIGKKLDSWLETEKPYMVALLVSLGVTAYMIKLYYETQNKKKNKREL